VNISPRGTLRAQKDVGYKTIIGKTKSGYQTRSIELSSDLSTKGLTKISQSSVLAHELIHLKINKAIEKIYPERGFSIPNWLEEPVVEFLETQYRAGRYKFKGIKIDTKQFTKETQLPPTFKTAVFSKHDIITSEFKGKYNT